MFLKSILHLLNNANRREPDYMECLLELIKTVVDKGTHVQGDEFPV